MAILPAVSSAMHGAVVPIANANLTGNSTYQFTNIPSVYQDLRIVYYIRSASATSIDGAYINFNSDAYGSNTNYSNTTLQGDGSSAISAKTSSANSIPIPLPGASSTSGIFGVVTIDILNYANTTTNKTCIIRGSADLNGSGQVRLLAGLWRNTAAISTVSTLINGVSGNTATLYGIRTVGQ